MMLMHTVLVLADEKSPTNVGPDFGKAGPFGLTVVVLLLVGTFFLIRSMNAHLRKLPETFDPEHPEPDQAVDDGTVGTSADKPETPSDSTDQRGDDR
ncbi:hypothetical protein [Mycobacteroides franklinii]|uniref:Uncharacterized protein n=1 Tax=Mycobacteroides franklinii TaxID=948102 RepID=A0A4R8R6Z9_9MYCO|nr:hypothetical protein [Mycobacteroides franklinii]ORA61717.1 hypothetical protein BST24_09675 [Mycobacteroides franklinii]TDH19124.1 hypothetical protein EJ571_21355 [Mycobacteroides franklinii]TDZ41827.1 hypothetical protein CCUG64054_01861 [Mycobacteroides franklinii]TDZ51975.1 hypothetical protein CCUG63697_00446 [Mycobacteroides franklinii]TDZ55382.1 hypothetical protein CCUG63696_01864 [Mycobacteroides franklinii]